MKVYKNRCLDCDRKVDTGTKRCKTCYDKLRENTKEARKLKNKEYRKNWYLENKERVIKEGTERQKKLSPDIKKGYILKSKYGIGIEEYKNLLINSDYKCNICGKHHLDTIPLNVDHCHTTKIVRGLLCRNCNTALGHLQDSVLLLKNAIKYLKNK